MASRERRLWTLEEDELLRAAVLEEEPGNQSPSRWYAIATHVPGRTNKDCRKRWFGRMAGDIVRGVWSAEEDAKLMAAVEKYGTKWSLVATMVHSRNSDQCAKRWSDSLDPSIDRASWLPEQDQLLLDAVIQHGTCWKKIVRAYFPGKTGLSAKNRYTSLSRHQHISQGLHHSRSEDDDVNSSTSSRKSNEHLYSTPPEQEHLSAALLRPSSSQANHISHSAENYKWDTLEESYNTSHDQPTNADQAQPSHSLHSDGYWDAKYSHSHSSPTEYVPSYFNPTDSVAFSAQSFYPSSIPVAYHTSYPPSHRAYSEDISMTGHFSRLPIEGYAKLY